MDGLTWMEWADHEALMGRAAPALAAARQVTALYPGEGAAEASLARAWLAARMPDSARTALERAMTRGWHDEGEREAARQMLEELRAVAARRPPVPLVPAPGPR